MAGGRPSERMITSGRTEKSDGATASTAHPVMARWKSSWLGLWRFAPNAVMEENAQAANGNVPKIISHIQPFWGIHACISLRMATAIFAAAAPVEWMPCSAASAVPAYPAATMKNIAANAAVMQTMKAKSEGSVLVRDSSSAELRRAVAAIASRNSGTIGSVAGVSASAAPVATPAAAESCTAKRGCRARIAAILNTHRMQRMSNIL